VAPKDAKRHATQAILVTCAVYLVYGGLRQLVPGEWAGFLIIAAFYFVPGFVLRKKPELAAEYQVGPDMPVPKWSWRGAKVAVIASLIVFPIFALGTFWFYWRVCGGDLRVLSPVLWIEALTPAAGNLEGFMTRLCRGHAGGLWPIGVYVPAGWVEWYGGGFVKSAAIAMFAVALPEEVFHRGYLMSALEKRWPPKRKVFGVPYGWAAVLTSVMFAVGHLVGEASTDRLATFFPALVFAWLWRRSGSLWAPALFHAASNLLMEMLLTSTFPNG
jgi:membrane protease YdiL (CAAX protease family)